MTVIKVDSVLSVVNTWAERRVEKGQLGGDEGVEVEDNRQLISVSE